VYTIPATDIRWDQPNLIAVRVYDSGGNGGMYASPAVFRVKNAGDLLTVKIVLPNPDHVIRKIGAFPLTAMLGNTSKEEINGRLSLVVFSDFKEKVKTDNSLIKIKPLQNSAFTFQVELPPGFYHAELSLEGVGLIHDFWFAVEPEKVVSVPDGPSDFADFWQRARRELDAVAPQFRMIEQDSLSTATRICYLVEMRSLGNVLYGVGILSHAKKAFIPVFCIYRDMALI
jgi:hypothetical protein